MTYFSVANHTCYSIQLEELLILAIFAAYLQAFQIFSLFSATENLQETCFGELLHKKVGACENVERLVFYSVCRVSRECVVICQVSWTEINHQGVEFHTASALISSTVQSMSILCAAFTADLDISDVKGLSALCHISPAFISANLQTSFLKLERGDTLTKILQDYPVQNCIQKIYPR